VKRNLLQQIAGDVGKALGTFERQRIVARDGRKRAAFLDAWAESEKWRGGNYLAEGAQRRALTNSWIYTAVGMIAREVSAAEFQVTRQNAVDTEPVQIPSHPLEQLLWRPNPYMGRAYVWQYLTYWLELNGNAYWFVALDWNIQNGAWQKTPVEIWPLPAQSVEVIPGDGERFVDCYEYTVGGQIFQIPAEYVVHFQLPNPFDIFRGLSPLVAAMLPTDADLAMARWNGSFFGRDNVMPSAIINLKSGDPNAPIDQADAETLKSALRSEYQAARRKTAITTAPGGVEAVLLGWNPKDMDFIQGRQFTKDEIFAIYGVPGGLLDKNATEANATIADQVFKEKTIWPLLILLAEQLTAQLTIPYYGRDMRAGFADIRPANRALELQEVIASGPYLTVDEVRERYWQRPALPDGAGETPPAAAQPGGAPVEGAPYDFFRGGDAQGRYP